ncbi:MFS transporter [Methanothermobacter wolfeii]|uniref:MFS transporter n=1 Tax=Methanothermobacter wolfeii TaxID=145261 RepID=A0A9E7RT68_METWO|nr:MFS transporter [Methanothermobacter wolfeii]NLM02513.1 MFS transporter [Methanothermobacter wolfeii]UXH31067.1 MFS transporter [Methanothermobacter wolfeii]SCM57558.1 putative protein Mb2288 [Methanothermobacter wolfeii]
MKKSTKFIIILGIVSLFADMTYEGARGITGPFLGFLGASAFMVGFAAGFGELSGYLVRFISGQISERTGRYWLITFTGYLVNLIAVPLLALAGNWQVAVLLIILERLGKGLRTPPRDAMLSYAASEMGHGTGFGVHEALDQIGAVAGPLVVFAVLALGGDCRDGFLALAVPAVIAISVLALGYLTFPRPRELEASTELEYREFRGSYWIYMAAVCFIALGYADFPLVGYHLGITGTMEASLIPLIYSTAMLMDAVSAVLFGRYFDRYGFRVMALAVLVSMFYAPLSFLGGPALAFTGAVLWGVGMGAQESVMRAAVSRFSPPERRGSAYGTFNTIFGVAWFSGSLIMGYLYGLYLQGLVIFSITMQTAAIIIILSLERIRT